jgi:hypothetical protein
MAEHVHIDCASCGIDICLTRAMYGRRRRDGVNFYCPNGHSNHYVPEPTAEQKRIAELEHELATEKRLHRGLSREFDEVWAAREELIRALKECPGGCGWHSRRQVPRDPVSMGRGIERVRLDVAQHLIDVHGAGSAENMALVRELTERT